MNQPDSAKLVEYLRKLTSDLVDARRELQALRGEDPVVIVGMGCRYPGGIATPDGLWEAVAMGRDLVGDFPTDRGWPDLPECENGTVPRCGAFLEDAAGFDNRFFKISGREALAMDPQQRISLEVAWETLESAGVDPVSLKGAKVGVYMGATSFQYGGDPVFANDDVAGHLMVGTVPSVLSGRISYTLGVHGPSITLDTACSSALVAVHLAAVGLRSGECNLALAGGATVMATPGIFVEFQRQGGLSSDGRCRAFADEADGTGWGEAVTMVALERLSTAREAGHPVLAVVKGSAWNHGGAANGLTAPNGQAQRAVIREAMKAAGLGPDDIDAIEGHGTGTRLGDPVEVNALLDVFRPRSAPLWLGSLKSNTAHTQAASGTGGLIKMVEALRHETLPRTLHAEHPTSEADWDAGSVRLLQEEQPWKMDPERPRRAGVSAFGVGGTNAHVILEEAPPAPECIGVSDGTGVLMVSAAGPEALNAVCNRFAEAAAGISSLDVETTLARRAALPSRLAVLAENSVVEALQETDGETGVGVVVGCVSEDPRPVMVFPGQGSQWPGMTVDLLAEEPSFAEQLDACDCALAPYVDYSVRQVLLASAEDPNVLAPVDVVQPVLWAVMVSLAALWRAHGVEPAAVIGHSQGEIAAAVVSGHLTLEAGARLVALRSRLLRRISGSGGMLSLLTDVQHAEKLILPWADQISVAVINGPGVTVVAGGREPLALAAEAAERSGIRCRVIDVDYASHSPQVDELEAEILAAAPSSPIGEPICSWYSTVTGDLVCESLAADYWFDNLRSTVRLDLAVEAALRNGHRLFIEVSPHPVLTYPLDVALDGSEAYSVSTLQRDLPGVGTFVWSAANAWVRGAHVDRDSLLRPGGQIVSLPPYPFQNTPFWYQAVSAPNESVMPGLTVAWRAALAPRAAASAENTLLLGDPDDELAAKVAAHLGIAEVTRLRDADVAEVDRVIVVAPLTDAGTAVLATTDVLRGLQQSGGSTTLALLTRGAIDREPAQAAVMGCVGSFAAEEPDRTVIAVDLDTAEAPLDAAAGCLMGDESGCWAVAEGALSRRHLVDESRRVSEDTIPGGTTVILGGLGRVGSAIARALAARDARKIVLVARGEATDLLDDLRSLGSDVTLVCGDAADPALLRRVLAEESTPVGLVVHAAGHVADEPIARLSAEGLASVLDAKLGVAEAIDSVLEPSVPLLITSGLPGTLGVAGQAAWSAAAAAVDAVAMRRAGRGAPTRSVALGGISWSPAEDDVLRRLGFTPWTLDSAVEALLSAFTSPQTHQIWAELNPAAVAASGRVRSLADLGLSVSTDEASTAAPLMLNLSQMPRDEAHRRLDSVVRGVVARVLAMGEAAVDDAVSFKDLGLDSLTAVQLRNRLAAAVGLRLPVTVAFDHPTPALLTTYLLDLLVPIVDDGSELEDLVDHLEHLLGDMDSSNTARQAALVRLRTLLTAWTARDDGTTHLPTTDEDLFAALDAELGSI